MGVFIISISLIIIGVLLIVYYIFSKCSECSLTFDVGFIIAAIGLIATLICGAICAYVQIPKQINYQNKIEERKMIEYRLTHEKWVRDNEGLMKDITEFNKELRTTKYYANSFWVGCYWNDLIADIDYIVVEE